MSEHKPVLLDKGLSMPSVICSCGDAPYHPAGGGPLVRAEGRIEVLQRRIKVLLQRIRVLERGVRT